MRVAAAHCIALLAEASHTVMSGGDEDEDEEEGVYAGPSHAVGDTWMSTNQGEEEEYNYGDEDEEDEEEPQGLEHFVGVTEDEVSPMVRIHAATP